MAQFKESYSKTTSVTQTKKVNNKTYNVTETVSKTEVKPKTFRQSEQGIFNLVTSLSTYIIVLAIIVLAGTTTYYNDNKENLSWVNDNGEFIETSYIRNNDQNVSDLNNLSLNDVFNNNNLILNHDFSNGLTDWYSYQANVQLFSNVNFTATLRYGNFNTNTSNYTDGNRYWALARAYLANSNQKLYFNDGVTQADFNSGIYNSMVDHYGDYIVSNNATRLRIKLQDNNISNWQTAYLEYFYLIDLTALGIDDLTNDEVYNYFNMYLDENYVYFNDLGSIPVSNYSTIGTLITTVVETMNEFLNGWISFYEAILSIF